MRHSNAQMVVWNDDQGSHSEPVVDYHRQWRAFGIRRGVALYLLYGWIPICVGLFELSRMWIHQPIACLFGMVLWFASALIAVWWAGEFRCPRCRRRYAALGHRNGATNMTRGLFDRVCSNCKLTKFEIVR